MSTKKHPAFVLFEQMFSKACENPPIESPTHYVKRNIFIKAVHEAGIQAPKDFVGFVDWEEQIGLPEFVHRLIAKHHKKCGTDFSPMEKGAWRLRNKLKKNGLPTQPKGQK